MSINQVTRGDGLSGHDSSGTTTRSLSRRDLLGGAATAGAVALLSGVVRPQAADADNNSGGLGAFLISIVSNSSTQPMQHGVLALCGGGVAVSISDAPRGTHLGSWQAISGGGIQFRLIAFEFDSSGTNTGFLQVDATGQQRGDAITATYTVPFTPVGGSAQVVDQGSLSGSRLQS